MQATVTHTAMGYRATRDEDSLTVHSVPIFCECTRGELNFDAVWIGNAVQAALQSQREGYMPPLHIRHHEPETAATNAVRAAGFFKVLGAQPITLKGSRRLAIMADLIITDPQTIDEVLARRLPYRSVEIIDVEEPAIASLALLDHEAPFLELPMLMVSEIRETGVPSGTFRQSWAIDATWQEGPVVACFRKGASAHLLFEENDMAEEETKDPQGALFADDTGDDKSKDYEDKKKPEDGENMEDGGLDVSAVVKAIKDGSISVADMDAILEAIQEQRGAAAPEEESEEVPAPAAVPGAESMSKDQSEAAVKMAALQGKIDALEARGKERDEKDARREDVAKAMKRLDGRPLGSDLEQRLVTFHKEHGAKAFQAYVDEMAKTFGLLPVGDGGPTPGAKEYPEVVMKFSKDGDQAVERAMQFYREWEELRETGHYNKPADTYIGVNMRQTLV